MTKIKSVLTKCHLGALHILLIMIAGIPANVGLDPVSEMINSLQLSSDSMSAGSSNQKSPGKKKITKADFVQAAGGAGSIDDLTKKNEKSDDPLSQLDPLWSLKSKWYNNSYFCKEGHEMWRCANAFTRIMVYKGMVYKGKYSISEKIRVYKCPWHWTMLRLRALQKKPNE